MKINSKSITDAAVSICKSLGVVNFTDIQQIRRVLSQLRNKSSVTFVRHKNLKQVLIEVRVNAKTVLSITLPPYSGAEIMEDWMRNNNYIGEPRRATDKLYEVWQQCGTDPIAYKIDVVLERKTPTLENWDFSINGWRAQNA